MTEGCDCHACAAERRILAALDVPPRKAWTVHEVAVSVGVSDSTVRAWIRDGKLRAFQDGSITRVPVAALDELLAAR